MGVIDTFYKYHSNVKQITRSISREGKLNIESLINREWHEETVTLPGMSMSE